MIEFRAFGSARLTGPDGIDTDAVLVRPKLLGVLAYLSVGPARGFLRRDTLMGIFWPELSQERARSAVRQSLYRLRAALGDEVIQTRGDDEVALSEESFWCDVRTFEDALDHGDREAALALYGGDLLEGLYLSDAPGFERWLDERRATLRMRGAEAAWAMAEEERERRNTAAAGQWSRRATRLAPLDEALLRRVIRLLDRIGDRAGAVREYEAFAQRLAAELDLEPAPETRALIDAVRARASAVQPSAAPGSSNAGAAMPSDGPSDDPGRALEDRYRIEREIGRGGMARVLLAHDRRHNRPVAIKVMHRELSASLGVERFLREIEIAAQLTHPHIVPLYDSGEADGALFFVMPFIDGVTLRERLDAEGPLSIDEAVRIAAEIAEGLDCAHRNGVVHRDIKPENVLLADGHAMITDFGIARAVSAVGGGRLTVTGLAIGTPSYMSPEQSAASNSVDHRSDLYSLGCVLYEMLAGEPPYRGATAAVVRRQQELAGPRPIAERRTGVPAPLADVVSRALVMTPADRIQSAAAFGKALERSMVLAAPASDAIVPGGWWRRRRVQLGTVGVVAAVAILLVVGSMVPDAVLDRNRVLVLPFENRTGDSTLALLGNFAADWIARGLHEIEIISVVPTGTSVERGPSFSGIRGLAEPSAARVAGEATGAGTVVTGAYYRRGDTLDVQAQVIDASDERVLRSVEPITGLLGSEGDVLDSLRAYVVTAVASELDQRLLASAAASPPPSLEAYRIYLEGHRAFNGVGGGMRESLDYMYRAARLDSSFVDPRFYIVMAHWNLGEPHLADSNARLLTPYRPDLSEYQRAFLDWLTAGLRGDRAGALRAARARGVAADVAVEALASNRAHETIAILSTLDGLEANYFKWHTLIQAYHMVGDHQGALREAERARAVYPDRMLLLLDQVSALAALGRADEAGRGIDESLSMAPEPPLNPGLIMDVASREFRAHGYRDAALAVARRAIDWFASHPGADADAFELTVGRALALYRAERWEAAREIIESLAEAAPDDVLLLGMRGVLAARRGDDDEARRIMQRIEGKTPPYQFGQDVYWQACIAAQLGELDRAMDLLREAYARGRMFAGDLHIEMDLEPLRGRADYREFVEPKR